MAEGYVIGRHTDRSDKSDHPESEDYPGITENGLEMVRERALKIKEFIDQASPGAIVFMGGTSEEDRTKSTARAFGDELARAYEGSDQVLVLTISTIESAIEEKRQVDSRANAKIVLDDFLKSNPDKKIVIARPLFVKELSLRPFFREDQTGEHTQFTKDLYEKGNDDEAIATDVLMGKGNIVDEMQSPIALQDLALRQIKAMNRLRKFAGKFAQGRELIISLTGHAWNLDALLSYLANAGEANYEGYTKTGGQEIDQSEIATLEIEDRKALLKYRNKTYEIPTELI